LEVNLISRDGRQGQDPALVGDLKFVDPHTSENSDLGQIVSNRVNRAEGWDFRKRFDCKSSSAVSVPKHWTDKAFQSPKLHIELCKRIRLFDPSPT
jgi:hypothetical protein